MQSFRDGFRRLFTSQEGTVYPVCLAMLCTSQRSFSVQEITNENLNETDMTEPQLLALRVGNDLRP